MNPTLYLTNVSHQATEPEIAELFATVGAVTAVRLVLDPDTGRPRGFAFVEMADEVGAAAALDKFNDFEWHGQRLSVRPARPDALDAAA